ncbi:MAG TPA: hypothetical protein VNW92_19235 [Polyangiaceae bacterium]|nr:hypothetical protein [Polyangiaceae bacterium]
MLVDVDAMIGRIARPLDEKTKVYVVMLAVMRAAGAVMAFRAGHLSAVPIDVHIIDDRDREAATDDEPLDRAVKIVLPRYAARKALSIEWEAMSRIFPELAGLSVQFEHYRHALADVIADDHGRGAPGELGLWMRQAYEDDQAEREADGKPRLADAPDALPSEARSSRIMLAFYAFAFGLEWSDNEIPWSSPRTLDQAFKNWLNKIYRQPSTTEPNP